MALDSPGFSGMRESESAPVSEGFAGGSFGGAAACGGLGGMALGNRGMLAPNRPPASRNVEWIPGFLAEGALGWMITAFRPNGRLNTAAKGTPAATLAMLFTKTGPGANGTSFWMSGEATSSGAPSEAGSHSIGPMVLSPVDSIGSQEN